MDRAGIAESGMNAVPRGTEWRIVARGSHRAWIAGCPSTTAKDRPVLPHLAHTTPHSSAQNSTRAEAAHAAAEAEGRATLKQEEVVPRPSRGRTSQRSDPMRERSSQEESRQRSIRLRLRNRREAVWACRREKEWRWGGRASLLDSGRTSGRASRRRWRTVWEELYVHESQQTRDELKGALNARVAFAGSSVSVPPAANAASSDAWNPDMPHPSSPGRAVPDDEMVELPGELATALPFPFFPSAPPPTFVSY